MPRIGNDGLGKKAEEKIKQWLDKPENGYSFDRFYDQMTGYFMTSRNICDFICYKHPNQYYIESKATYEDRFTFSALTETQHDGLLAKSAIPGAYGLVIVLFATYQQAFILDIRDIKALEDSGKKSLNIKKINIILMKDLQILSTMFSRTRKNTFLRQMTDVSFQTGRKLRKNMIK